MNKNWSQTGLYALLVTLFIPAVTACTALIPVVLEKPSPRETWEYSKLIQEVQRGKVESVKLNADRTRAVVTAKDGNRVFVHLPNDPKLIDILVKHEVDITVLPP